MKAQLQVPTATASFSCGRVHRNSLSVCFLVLTLFLLLSLLTACDTLKTRDDVRQTPPARGGTRQSAQPGTRGAVTSSQTPATGGTPAPVASPTPAPVSVAPPIPVPAPAVLGRELPKIGVILGPGGMKAFAELGVLREMSRARIPIHAIVGLEWGSAVAASFAAQGQINDAEWKMFKLKDSELPSESFLSSRLKPASVSSLKEFFDSAFGSATIDRNHVDFACPEGSRLGDKSNWYVKGTLKDAVAHCLPYPPLYSDNAGWIASPFSIEESAAWLRSRGANVIVLVNVVAQGEFFPSKMNDELATENVLWGEIRREMTRAHAPAVNHVINVNTSGYPITDFSSRRALMDLGQKAAVDPVSKMISEYGF